MTVSTEVQQRDMLRVRGPAERPREAGLRASLDEWAIRPGDDIYLAIERGIGVVPVGDGAGSEWMTPEPTILPARSP